MHVIKKKRFITFAELKEALPLIEKKDIERGLEMLKVLGVDQITMNGKQIICCQNMGTGLWDLWRMGLLW